ncbi:MAG: hypothetical protein NVSMB19_01770 [Vulcanimicrobiaceae bacterium]
MFDPETTFALVCPVARVLPVAFGPSKSVIAKVAGPTGACNDVVQTVVHVTIVSLTYDPELTRSASEAVPDET